MHRLSVLVLLAACAKGTTRVATSEAEVITLRRSYNNAHLVRTAAGAILVDAGLERDAPALADDLQAAGVSPSELALVVLTHGHADHAGGAAWFRDTWGVPILAGVGDAPLLGSGHNDTLCPTDGMAEGRHAEAQAEVFTPLQPDQVVAAGASLDLGTLGLVGEVTSLPGHTPGSLVLRVGDAVVVGDLLRGSVTGAAARTHFFQCDLADNRADVAHVRTTLASEAQTWFVGHFGPLSAAAVDAWLGEAR